MKTRLMIASGAVLLAAAVSSFVYVNNERNSMDDLFNANVEALAQSEGTPVSVCYTDNGSGEWDSAIFCNSGTSSSMLYPCPTLETWGYKGATSYCTR